MRSIFRMPSDDGQGLAEGVPIPEGGRQMRSIFRMLSDDRQGIAEGVPIPKGGGR